MSRPLRASAIKYTAFWKNNDPYLDPTKKRCTKCKLLLNRKLFNGALACRDGLNSRCRKCNNIWSKEYRNKNKLHWANNDPYADTSLKCCGRCEKDLSRDLFMPEKNKRGGLKDICRECYSIYRRIKHRNDPRLQMLHAAARRARLKNLPFTITAEDIIIPEFCPLFYWVKLIVNDGLRQDNSPSLDRIDNSLGYTPNNIRVISYRANRLKSNATTEEMIALGKDAKRYNK